MGYIIFCEQQQPEAGDPPGQPDFRAFQLLYSKNQSIYVGLSSFPEKAPNVGL